METIDQANIRGSKPHNHDPSGAASDYYRESGKGLSQISGRGFSFVLAAAAADLVHELNCLVQVLLFSYLEGFVFSCGNGLSRSFAGSSPRWPKRGRA